MLDALSYVAHMYYAHDMLQGLALYTLQLGLS